VTGGRDKALKNYLTPTINRLNWTRKNNEEHTRDRWQNGDFQIH
jgi:hypothetical protein